MDSTFSPVQETGSGSVQAAKGTASGPRIYLSRDIRPRVGGVTIETLGRWVKAGSPSFGTPTRWMPFWPASPGGSPVALDAAEPAEPRPDSLDDAVSRWLGALLARGERVASVVVGPPRPADAPGAGQVGPGPAPGKR
jgi:hypothetical protein